MDLVSHSESLSRRQVVLQSLAGAVGLMGLAGAESKAVAETVSETAFVPENDYPFFGYDPQGAQTGGREEDVLG